MVCNCFCVLKQWIFRAASSRNVVVSAVSQLQHPLKGEAVEHVKYSTSHSFPKNPFLKSSPILASSFLSYTVFDPEILWAEMEGSSNAVNVMQSITAAMQ